MTLGPAAAIGDWTKEVSGRSENHSAKSVNEAGAELGFRDTERTEQPSPLCPECRCQESCPWRGAQHQANL